jgi:hypothetical protein
MHPHILIFTNSMTKRKDIDLDFSLTNKQRIKQFIFEASTKNYSKYEKFYPTIEEFFAKKRA